MNPADACAQRIGVSFRDNCSYVGRAHDPEGYAPATGGAIRPAAMSIGAAAIARRAVILMVHTLITTSNGRRRPSNTTDRHFDGGASTSTTALAESAPATEEGDQTVEVAEAQVPGKSRSPRWQDKFSTPPDAGR